MDANNFVMSSYQFVNSLAQCYPQTTANTNNNNNNSSGVNQSGGNDYFPAAAYTPNLYPGTPQAHYTNPQAYNPLAGTGAQGQNDMVDYTQLQPQKFLLNQQQQQSLSTASCKYASETSGGGGGVGGGGGIVGGITNNNNNNNNNSNNNNNNNTNSTSISSPQDLTTARDISPKLSPNSVVDNVVARTLNSKTANASVTSSNPVGNAGNGGLNNNSNSRTILPPLGSPDGDESDASSDSGTEGGSGQGSGKKSGAPPHIYPWMKRVHIGQSKYNL